MAVQPTSPGSETALYDPAKPLRGVVVCCTSIPPEQRSDIATKTAELGGIHKYDLTPDITHLIVGEYDTPKYRHVAKERSDIRPMAAGWIEAVRALWMQDAEIDFTALEKTWQLQTFETGGGDISLSGAAGERGRLLCCLTGFDDPERRQQVADTITAHGAAYSGDLTRRVTHLIVCKPEGRKYAAAKSWGVITVSIEWLEDSTERGMILDEKLYDPVLPKEEIGRGAWLRKEVESVALGKRLRDGAAAGQEEGKRKLRKTASLKINSQRDNLWGDILGKPPPADPAAQPGDQSTQPDTAISAPRMVDLPVRKSSDTQDSKLASLGNVAESQVFTSCLFFVSGFERKRADILVTTVAYLGGLVCHSFDELSSNSGAQLAKRFLIVPQNSRAGSYHNLPDNVQIVTEFFIERCMHKKQLFEAAEHVIGQPFPVFPIPGFESLILCTSGFTGLDLNQVHKAIVQLGARYEERFTAQSSVLLCTSLKAVRKQKLDLALAWKVPVVSADWLWDCISTGLKVQVDKFLLLDLQQKPNLGTDETQKIDSQDGLRSMVDPNQKPQSTKPAENTALDGQPDMAKIDTAAFGPEKKPSPSVHPLHQASVSQHQDVTKEDSNATTHFDTAPMQQQPSKNFAEPNGQETARPLSKATSNSLNRSPSRLARNSLRRRSSEIANSEDNDGATTCNENGSSSAARRAAADRQELSAKLSTLLSGGAGTDSDGRKGSGETLSAGLAALGAAARPPVRAARRRREILGRAISNASAVSSASGGAAVEGSNGLSLSAVGSLATGAIEGEGLDAPEPSGTQIEYADPEAARRKEMLMRKMRGDVVVDEVTVTAEDRLTLSDLSGYGAATGGTRVVGRVRAGMRTRKR